MRRFSALARASGRGVAGGLIAVLAIGLGGGAEAKDCGGAVACECGDRVTASITLTDHLDSCEQNGLVLAAGTLDCADHQISGPGDRTEWAGVLVQAAQSATVRNCRVRNFGDGIRVEAGDTHLLTGNVVFDNLHGIWVGGGAVGTRIESNEIHDNRDEGVHLGSGTSASELRDNQIYSNDAENVYLLGTTGNLVENNVLGSANAAGIFVKHSQNNTFLDNQVLDQPVLVRGDSFGNYFEGNVLSSGGYAFEAFEEEDGTWTYPHDQTVVGGSVDASTCFEILGSFDNTATDVVVDDCRHVEQKALGGLVPYGNVISVIDISPETGEEGGPGASSTGDRTGRIRRSAAVGDDKDLFKVAFDFTPGTAIDPSTEEVEITISDDDSIVYRATLPAGSIEKKNASLYQFVGDPAESPGGVQRLRIRFHPAHGWSCDVKARTNLESADEAGLQLEWRVGNDQDDVTDQWLPKTNGWRLP